MTADASSEPGSIAWFDLTVPDATSIKDFYAAVVGWQAEPVDMGGYQDFAMTVPGSGAPIAGVCHSRGVNANLPPQWLVYIVVDDLDASVQRCIELGGSVIAGPRGSSADGHYCVIQDPSGAVAALVKQP